MGIPQGLPPFSSELAIIKFGIILVISTYGTGLMMAFEWDDKKNTLNRQKHGIDFSTAIAVFDDPNRLEEDSTQPEHGEIRIRTIGMAGSSVLVLTVIYTDREQNKRIISARCASKDERKRYMSFIN